MPFLSIQTDGCLLLNLHVQPRASRTCLKGVHGDALKLAITAPPVDGKANKEVIAFLAGFFKIPKREITIVSGLQSRSKRCRICSLSESEARTRITAQIAQEGLSGGK